MERLKVQAKKRDKRGKEYAKKIRREGLVPGIIYKKGFTLPLELKETDLIHLIHKAHSENIVLELEIVSEDQSKERKTAIVKAIAYDPVKGKIMHIDFQEISLEEIVRVKVPIEIKGEAIGVKRDGGLLEHLLWEVEVECKAVQIPEKIEVDVSNLGLGEVIHLSDLTLPPGVKVMAGPDVIVAHIVSPKVEVIKEEEVAVEEEVKEPEVIREKKEEELPEE